ncbi:hypothetical protein [Trichloromonas sp.]|uniref:hypothetical protein n=1 Tax=Trichloromonas sp. TaxID=3069249 RepID=UPI003D8151E6
MANRVFTGLFALLLCVGATVSLAAPNGQIVIFDKGQAAYDTPENALNSFFSACMAEDLKWYFQTLTAESAAVEKADNEENQLDPMVELAMFRRGFVQGTITETFDYLEARVLVVRITDDLGDQFLIPYTLVKEGGDWKVTNKFSDDEALEPYSDFIPKLYFGHGQRPADVNAFLGYHQPQEATTTMEKGITSFDLQIYYGGTIDPATFTATLNKKDIRLLFEPFPGSRQFVALPLESGRNVLELSVEGLRSDGKTAQDSDRLVFIVSP